MEAQGLLQNFPGFFPGPRIRLLIRFIRFHLTHQAGQRLPVEARLETKVAAGGLLHLRMRGQPTLTLDKQLLDLIFADKVVFAAVKNGHQDVKVRQKLGERGGLVEVSEKYRLSPHSGKRSSSGVRPAWTS